jgi:hypothetical protein
LNKFDNDNYVDEKNKDEEEDEMYAPDSEDAVFSKQKRKRRKTNAPTRKVKNFATVIEDEVSRKT